MADHGHNPGDISVTLQWHKREYEVSVSNIQTLGDLKAKVPESPSPTSNLTEAPTPFFQRFLESALARFYITTLTPTLVLTLT